jgi:hypothetical protein
VIIQAEHDSCYGHGCASCLYRGTVRDYEAEEDYYDYKRDARRDDEMLEQWYLETEKYDSGE